MAEHLPLSANNRIKLRSLLTNIMKSFNVSKTSTTKKNLITSLDHLGPPECEITWCKINVSHLMEALIQAALRWCFMVYIFSMGNPSGTQTTNPDSVSTCSELQNHTHGLRTPDFCHFSALLSLIFSFGHC